LAGDTDGIPNVCYLMRWNHLYVLQLICESYYIYLFIYSYDTDLATIINYVFRTYNQIIHIIIKLSQLVGKYIMVPELFHYLID